MEDHPWAATGKYSSYYELRREEQGHAHHAREFAARNIGWIRDRRLVDTIVRSSEEAATALENGMPEEAIAACHRALALNPNHARSLHCLAMAEWGLGRGSDALAHITHAREVDDADPAIARAWTEISSRSPPR